MQEQDGLLKDVSSEIDEKKISKIELYYVPSYIQMGLALTTQRLFTGRPLVITLTDNHKLKDISLALRNTTPINKVVRSDIRVGIIVYGQNGQKRLMVAVGRNGGAEINSSECVLKGRLYRVLVSIAEGDDYSGISFKQKVLKFYSKYL